MNRLAQITLISFLLLSETFAIDTSLGRTTFVPAARREPLYFKLEGGWWQSRKLYKGKTKIDNTIHKFKVKDVTKDDIKAYEAAVRHERNGAYANASFYGLVGSVAAGIYGTWADKDGIQAFGIVGFLLSAIPYFYFRNISENSLYETIKNYNEIKPPVKLKRTSLNGQKRPFEALYPSLTYRISF